MTTRRALVPFALAILLSFSLRVPAGTQFSDGVLTNFTWTAAKILDTTAGQAAGFSVGEVPSGGVGGGPYRSNSFSYSYNGTATNQGILIGNLSSGIIYSPAVSGPINAVTSFSLVADATGSGGGAANVGLLLYQSGVYFTNHLQGIGGFGNPIKESSAQPASAFVRVGSSAPPLNPDFSTNGAPIQFGYVSAASLSTGTVSENINGVIGVDLYALSISNTPVRPAFIGEQASSRTNLLVTLTGLAPGETVSWYVSTNLATWVLDNPPNSASDTNGTFTVTNSVYPGASNWFLRALVQ